MEVNNTRKLYDALKSDGYTDLGDFSSFEGKLKDSGKREMLYDVLKKDGWQDLGDFSQFESELGYAPINNENIKETDYVSQSSVNPPPISLRQEVDIPKSDQSEYVNPWTNSPDYNFESLRKKGKIETATPPPPTEYEKDSSFMNTWVGDAIQKLNAGGADLGAGIFGVLDKAAKGLESATGGLIPRGGAFKDISDIFKADAEFSRARSNRYNGKDFTDLWKEGNYMGAIGDIALQGVESLPMSIGAMAATMAGAPAAGLAGIGSIVASQKYDDLDQNNPNMGEFAKVSNAILTGTAESLSEMLGAGVSKAWMSTLFKTLGKEKAQEAIKRGIMGKMQEFYKKFGMFFEPVNEGIEEVSSTLAENITDKITGADPERDLTDGVLQSFVYGMGGGAYFTGAGALAKGAQYVADKIGGKQAQQPITDSNVTDQGVETPPLLTKSRFAEAEEQGRNMTDPGDIRTASKKMEETRLSLSEMVPGLASTIESYVDDKASEAQVMSLLDGVNADARPLAEEFYADYLRISGLQDRIGDEIDNDVETYVANNITPYVTTNPDGQSIVTTATLSEGNVERPVYVRSIEGDKAVISDNGQDRMVSVKRLSDIVEQDVGHMRRTYEDQLLATRQSELDMTMNHNPKTQLPKPGLVIWNGDNAFILQEQDENGDWIAQPAALDKETGQVAPKAGSAPAMPITERDILALQDAMYDAQQADVSVSDQIEGDDMIDKAIENEILQSEGQSNMSENDSQKPVKSSEPKYPLTKDGKPDYKKMTAAQRFVYTSETVSPEEALSDLDADIRSAEEALNKIKGKISKATGAERMSLRDQIKAKESEIEEMRELLPNKDTEGQKMESLLKEEIKESDSLSEDDQENVIENIPQEKDEAVQSKGGETSILTREDGTPDFVSSGTDMTLDFLYDKYGDKMPRKIEVTRKSFDESLKKASDALEKAQEAYDDAPIGKEDKAEAALIKARQEYEAIKVEADFWANLDDDIKEASKKPGDVIAKEISVMGDPMSGEELAAMMLANGAIKLTRDSYKKETGAGNNETARMFGLFASPEKGGVNIERAGEILELADRENGTNFFDENDTNAGRDAIIEVLSSAHTRGDLIDYVKRNREAIAERERQAEYNAYAEWCEENYHMSPEEYEAYEDDLRKQAEIVTEETIEYVNGEIADEIQAIIDEQNEIDAILAQNNESNEEIERNDEGGTGGLLEGGDQLLQGEQPIQAGRTGETEQGFTGIDDRVDRTDGATQEGAPEEVDRQGNPIDSEGNLIIEDVSSVSDITDEDFINPKRSIGLPPIPQNVSEAIASDGKKVIIKRNIFEKNAKKHAFDPQSSRDILEAALYNTDIVGQSQPLTRKKHWVAIKLDDKSPIVVLEVNHNKDNVEIVGWYTLDNRNLDRIKRQAEREGGELLILTPKGAAASLSTLPDNSSSTDKGSISSSENQANEAKSFVAPSPNENENPLDYAERIVEAKRLFDEELKVNTNPSEAQKEAGNYKKGHIKINGFDVTIEQPAGSVRSGKDASGKEWSQVMNNTYGYIRGTESVDGDHIDVFLGPDMNSDMVYVVDQVNTDGSFDEHKVMMGFSSLEDARSAYLSNYEEGWQGVGNITGVALDEFKKWIDSSIRKTKPFYEYRSVDFIEEERPDSGIRFRETRISPEEENIIEKAKSDGSYMKAPNGNPTNLNEKQWVQVRTKAFKEWFGDWENNPEDASKVIDENGEPRVVYHGTYADFNAFDESHLGDVTDLNATNEDWAKTSHIGFWFNDNKIGFYTKHKPVFLNVRNPLEFASMESLVDEMSYYDSGEDFKRSNSDGYDSVIVLEDEEMGGRSYVVFNDNQIKSVTENNEDFSFHNDETSKNEAVKQASDIDGAHFRSIGDKDTDNLNNAETIESSINDWSNKLNTPVRVIHDVDDITDTDENMLARKRDSKGWYDTSTGEIVIVSPNSTSVGDAQRTFLHEVVGHHGLRELFGDDFDTFLDNVYRNANEDIRKNIIDRTKGNPLNLREATEEYIAELAERGFDNKAERSLWEKIKDSFLDMLRKAGISLDFKLSDNDLRYILWRSYKNLEQGNLMDVAEDIVMRNRLSLNNINLNENGSIARDIEPEKGKQPSETKGTGRELETIDGVDENGNESERDHIDKPRGVENAIDGTENATDRNGKKTDGQVDNDGDQLDGGDAGDRNGSVRDGIDGERTVIGRAGSENKGRGVGESVREKTDDFAFAEKTIRFRENARKESVLFADNDIQVVEKQVGSAKDQYERTLSTSSYQFQEAFQDSMLGLKTLQDAVAKATRSRILDYENAYMAENALSSVNEAEFNAYRKAAFEPILKAISRLEKMGSSIDEIRDYLITKHGIERNREMAVKRALSQNAETYKSLLDEYIGRRNEIRENGGSWEEQQSEMDRLAEEYGANLSDDFSGFTSMYPNEDNTGYDPDSARRYVLDYESRYDTSELSASVKRATDAILAKQRDSGLMSQNTFESISDMYQFYVPLRGWEETTADEVYAYLTSESQTFNAPIKTVVGRKSKADDPIATIANMAESGIMQGNRNLMKQKFLTMVQNHKTDLVSVSEMWVRLDEASGEWIAVFPDIPSNANPEQVESIVESFNKRMEELSNEKGSNVRRSRDAIGIPYKILPKDLKEHQVIVKRAGKEYVLTINGNPRAAQALNGLTNPDNTKGWFGTLERYAGWLNRNLAANFTTRNPNFMVSNFLRDALYSNTTVWVKESPVYAWKFNKNFAMVNPINMYRLVKGYENGTLDMSDPLNKAYHDFVMRGGETGYTNLRDVEAKKKAIQKELQYSKQKVSIGKALKILGEWMDLFNKSVENCARFAAFLTSREMGRSMDKSIYDAKEISVNFNKKGAGSKFLNTEGQTKIGNASAFTSGLSRSMYVFWNAGVQGMYNFGRLAKDNPKKFLGLASSFYLLGTIMPMIAAAFGDDEDDDYYDLPEYVRRNNICFRNGGGNWITIPMPIELRAIYGLGEMSSGIVSGKEKYTDKKMAMKIAEQMSQVLPLDMMEGGGGFSVFVPSSVKPLIEAGDNKDWTGLPLYKDNDFNKGMPEWTKAFKSVDPAILAMTKYANELTGGDKYTTGTVNLNPAIIEHILDGYFGGIEATRSQMVKSAETAWGSRDFDWRNIPVGNRLIKSGDERTKKKTIDNAYYENLEEMDKIGQKLRGYRKELSNPQNDSFDIAEYQKKLNNLMMSDEYRGYVEFNNLNKLYQSMGEYLKNVDDERLEMELYDLKAMMNEIANGK